MLFEKYSAVALVFGHSVVAIVILIQTATINAGRLSTLSDLQDRIAASAASGANGNDESGAEPKELKRSVTAAILAGGEVRAGAPGWVNGLGAFDPWFNKNSNDTNSMLLAISAGMLGAGLRTLRAWLPNVEGQVSLLPDLGQVCATLTIGGGIGLFGLLLLRGAAGMATFTSASALRADSPYGVAFTAGLAALFANEFFGLLERLVK